MSTVFAYKNIRDFEFILQEWLPTEEVFSYRQFRDYYSKDSVASILDPVRKMTKEIIEPANADAEKHPARFHDGKVTTPPLTGPLVKKLQAEGWGTANINDCEDATILPSVVLNMCTEMFGAAYPGLIPYISLATGASEVIQAFADEDIKRTFLPKLMNGEWAATMGLTEPHAGSDVGDITTRAFPTDNPRIFTVKGQKIFITGVENSYTDNIVNLFLARVEGAREGTAGISLFLIPKYWVNEDGSMESEINDIAVTGIEEKMGNHASPTCGVSIGDNGKCRGWLIGANPLEHEGRGDGMANMFKLMNYSRLGTGLLGLSCLAGAFYNARDYCKERIQGRPIADPRGNRVAIIEHEDIRRTLLLCKSHVEVMRAMFYKTYFHYDVKTFDPDPEKRKASASFVEVATPLCKAYPTDEAWTLIGEALQTFGGYGYCEEYPVAQLARDVRVYSIWEGTNFIQSMDLVGRKWIMDKGQAFAAFFSQISDVFESGRGNDAFAREFEYLGRAIEAYRSIQRIIGGHMQAKAISVLPLYAHRILTATSQLWGASLILEQAVIAQRKLDALGDGHFDSAFYAGKVACARYYVRNILPQVWLLAEIMEIGDTSALDVPLAAFDY